MEDEGRADLWGVPETRTKVPLAGGIFAHQGLPFMQCLVLGEESLEARPSKKRKVAMDKGKGKAKEVKEKKSEPEFGFRELVKELQGLRQDLKELWTDLPSTHHITVQVSNQTGDIADSVEDMARFYVPYQKEEVGNSGNAGVILQNCFFSMDRIFLYI